MKIEIADKSGNIVATILISNEFSVHIANENSGGNSINISLKEEESNIIMDKTAPNGIKKEETVTEEAPKKEEVEEKTEEEKIEAKKEEKPAEAENKEEEKESEKDIIGTLLDEGNEQENIKEESKEPAPDKKDVVKDILSTGDVDVLNAKVENKNVEKNDTSKETLKKILEINYG